jgi:hypothetical protein
MKYLADPFRAMYQALPLSLVLILIWLLYPTVIMTIVHPTDVVLFQRWAQGLPLPSYVSRREMVYGEFSAIVVLVMLTMAQFITILMMYRRLGRKFSTWLVVLILLAVASNLIWFAKTGYWDTAGATEGGLGPIAFVLGIDAVSNTVAHSSSSAPAVISRAKEPLNKSISPRLRDDL